MAAASYAQWVTLLQEVTEFYNDTYGTNSTLLTNYANALAAAIHDDSVEVHQALAAYRALAAGPCSTAAVQALLLPVRWYGADAIGAPERRGDFRTMMFRYWEYFIANSKTVNAREFTRGAASAGGSNVGTGTIRRLTVDEEGHFLEGSFTETKTFECRGDQNVGGSAEKHREIFEVRGDTQELTALLRSGSGIVGAVQAKSSKESEEWLVNPTFSQFSGTAPTAGVPTTCTTTTDFAGWVVTTAASAQASIDLAYRDFPGVTQTYSIKFTASNKIVQTVQSNTRARLSRGVPMYMQAAIYRKDAATGNVILRMGAVSRTVTLASLNDNAWNVVTIESSFTKNCYLRNFNEDALTIEVEVTSLAVGTVHIDDAIWCQWDLVDGAYMVMVGGATAFLARDTFTVADTIASDSVIQKVLWHAGNLQSLPSATGAAETIADT